MFGSRRDFAKALGAGVILLPFLGGTPRAATAPPRRLILINSLGSYESLLTPSSAPGTKLVLPDAYAPLQQVIGNIVLVHGLG